MEKTSFLKRTHTCGELRMEHSGQDVILNGWVQRRRDLGGLIFIDIRDRWGITQVVFNPQDNPALFKKAEALRNEYVIAVKGKVHKRPAGSENKNIPTGEIEVMAEDLQILNTSKTPPFMVQDDLNIDEGIRLKYRYVDLRRPKMLENFILRHNFTKAIRDYLSGKEFLEVETPVLVKSTPEGARDYIVPARVQPGKFYALPQSPQLFKQLLMVSGFERYFQIARCFRDEDLRADRQPEFTQVDMEMSFVEQNDVLSLIEGLMAYSIKEVTGREIKIPFPRMSWKEAMDRYGSDKPDIRFGMEIKDITGIVKDTTFQVFNDVIASNGVIRGINLAGCASFSRKQVDSLSDLAKKFGAKGVLTIVLKPGEFKSPLDKHLSDEQKEEIKKAFDAKEGDLIVIMAGEFKFVSNILGRLRLAMGKELNLIDESIDGLLWVNCFPMFAWDEDEQRIAPEHHMFTSPLPEDVHLLDTEPLKVRANMYDLVYNGNEVASGSIRIHDRKLQKKIMEIAGFTDEQAEARFGFLLTAFEYGAPPHGGIALGHDRICAILAGEESIREVIVFPKNTAGTCPLSGAPVEVDKEQLDLLCIEVNKKEAEKKTAEKKAQMIEAG